MKKIGFIVLSAMLLPAIAQAQSCNNSILKSAHSGFFIMNNDEAQDIRTQLIWKRCTVGQTWTGTNCEGTADSFTWGQALAAGTGGWRLPNIKELLSIVEVSCASPAINAAVFPDTSDLFFWTSSPYANNNQAWSVSFTDGNDEGGAKTMGLAVRLVKGAS